MRLGLDPRRLLLAVLVFVSVAMLAWSAGCVLGPWLGRPPASGPHTFTITPVGIDGALPKGVISVSGIIADDRFLRCSEVGLLGEWAPEDQWRLTHEARGDGAAAAISVKASRLTLGLLLRQDGGRVRIAGGGESVEVDVAGPWWRPVWIDLPSVKSMRFVPWLGFVLFGLVAGALRPWLGGRRLVAWLAVHLTALHVLFWASQTMGSTTDSPGYLDGIATLAAGRVNYYPPGYSLLLALCRLFSEDHLGATVTLVQHLMVVVCVLGVFLMLRSSLGEVLALGACLHGGSIGPALLAPQLVMTESLATFGMGFGLFLVWVGRQHRCWRWATAGGAIIGWGGLARVVPLVAALPAAAIVCMLPWRERWWRGLGAAGCGCAMVVLSMMAWFWVGSGRARLTEGIGLHLFNHFVNAQKLLDADGPATITVAKACGGSDLRNLPHWDVTPRLREAGYDWEASLDLVAKVAWEAASTAGPGEHLTFIAGLSWDNLMADSYDGNTLHPWTADRLPWIENPPLFGLHGSGLGWAKALRKVHSATWPWLSWLYLAGCILGLVRRDRCWATVAVAWMPIGYIVATSCVEYRLHRYNAALFPFMAAIAAVPVALVVRGRSHGVGGTGGSATTAPASI